MATIPTVRAKVAKNDNSIKAKNVNKDNSIVKAIKADGSIKAKNVNKHNSIVKVEKKADYSIVKADSSINGGNEDNSIVKAIKADNSIDDTPILFDLPNGPEIRPSLARDLKCLMSLHEGGIDAEQLPAAYKGHFKRPLAFKEILEGCKSVSEFCLLLSDLFVVKRIEGIRIRLFPLPLNSPKAIPLPPATLVKFGDKIEAKIAEFNSPSDFWLHLKLQAEALKNLIAEMNSFYFSFNLAETELKKGSKVAAFVETDSNWCRAIVEDEAAKKLRLVDFGTEVVNAKNVAKLDEKFANLPPFAFKARVSGLKPIEGVDWSRKAREKLLKLLVKAESEFGSFEAKIVDAENGVWRVDLSDGDEIDFGHALIERRLAQWDQEEL